MLYTQDVEHHKNFHMLRFIDLKSMLFTLMVTNAVYGHDLQ